MPIHDMVTLQFELDIENVDFLPLVLQPLLLANERLWSYTMLIFSSIEA